MMKTKAGLGESSGTKQKYFSIQYFYFFIAKPVALLCEQQPKMKPSLHTLFSTLQYQYDSIPKIITI